MPFALQASASLRGRRLPTVCVLCRPRNGRGGARNAGARIARRKPDLLLRRFLLLLLLRLRLGFASRFCVVGRPVVRRAGGFRDLAHRLPRFAVADRKETVVAVEFL